MFEFLFVLSLICPLVILVVKFFTSKARLARHTQRILNRVSNSQTSFHP